MADNIAGIPFNAPDEGINFPVLARELAYEQAKRLGVLDEHPTFSIEEVYLVWFAYTLGHFKALCSTSLPDGRYYEITYDSHSEGGNIAFVDTYLKTHNIAVNVTFTQEKP